MRNRSVLPDTGEVMVLLHSCGIVLLFVCLTGCSATRLPGQ
jgi:hypothetical protein